MPTRRREIGDGGEDEAARWLVARGFLILGRNVQVGRKEIDLVCRDGDEIVFVEVKAGKTDEYGHPVYRVTPKKRRALVTAARLWLSGHSPRVSGYRFDVVTVITDCEPPVIEHYPSAFAVDSC